MKARLVIVAALFCLLAACGDDDPPAVLDNNDPLDSGGGGGGDDDDCRVVDGHANDHLTLTKLEGPIDEVQKDSVFHLAGHYRLEEEDVDVYVIGTICNTTCEETKVTPPLEPGSGTYHSDFKVVAVPNPDASRNCLVVTMIAMDQRTLVTCRYHF